MVRYTPAASSFLRFTFINFAILAGWQIFFSFIFFGENFFVSKIEH